MRIGPPRPLAASAADSAAVRPAAPWPTTIRFRGVGPVTATGFACGSSNRSAALSPAPDETPRRARVRTRGRPAPAPDPDCARPVSYTHLRAHETDSYLVCRLLLEK